jgi:nucleoside-diphosphate-sugar epimerase
MRVLLTGALGNIGSHTLDALLEEGHAVVAFDLESPTAHKRAARLDDRVQVRWGDVTDPASIRAALDGVDAVVHLAAILNPEKAPDLARRVNVEATRSLIAQMEASSTARRLVFASSQGVFGDVQDRDPPLRVDTPVSPTDEYGRHKVACEEAIRSSRLQWSILRLAASPPIRLTGYAHDPLILFEFSPDARIEFIHPADAATAFARAVACNEAIGKILYIGGGEKCRTTHREFCNELMSAMGIGALPAEAFVRTEVRRFFGDWLDTEESERLLRYQKRGLSDLKADMGRDLGAIVPLIRLLRPVVTWYVTRSSPYLKENRRRSAPWDRHADEVAAEEGRAGEDDPQIGQTAQLGGSVPHLHELPKDDAHLHQRDQDRARRDRGVRRKSRPAIDRANRQLEERDRREGQPDDDQSLLESGVHGSPHDVEQCEDEDP